MSVKRTKSGSRLLVVLEEIARRQPVGVSELARVLEADKSAVQRAIMTLADDGWIHTALGTPTRWQLTGHIHLVAHLAHASGGLHQRARRVLEALRDDTGETVGLTVPDIGRFVIIDIVESRQMLRTVPHIGMVVVTADSATGRAVLPFLPRGRRAELLGREPDPELLEDFAVTLRQGYFVSEDDLVGGSINVAAPVFEADGQPVAAVILSAPRERVTPEHYARLGRMVLQAARALSRGVARPREALPPGNATPAGAESRMAGF